MEVPIRLPPESTLTGVCIANFDPICVFISCVLLKIWDSFVALGKTFTIGPDLSDKESVTLKAHYRGIFLCKD